MTSADRERNLPILSNYNSYLIIHVWKIIYGLSPNDISIEVYYTHLQHQDTESVSRLIFAVHELLGC